MRGKCRSSRDEKVSEKLLRASCGSAMEVTLVHPMDESETLNLARFASEKSLLVKVLGIDCWRWQGKKCSTGK